MREGGKKADSASLSVVVMLTAGKGGRTSEGRLHSEHASPAKKGRHAGVEGESGQREREHWQGGSGGRHWRRRRREKGEEGRGRRKGLLADEGKEGGRKRAVKEGLARNGDDDAAVA